MATSGTEKPTPLPEDLERGLREATAYLAKNLTCEHFEARTHRATLVAGWNADTEARSACAWYLVGQRVLAVSAALAIRADVADTPRDRLELRRNVERIVGTTADSLSARDKREERNPWMAEVLWHLCLFLASKVSELHRVGTVIAVSPPHVSAKDHGPDIVALYRAGAHFGMTIVESKAYPNNPNGAISDATAYFRQVDDGEHDLWLRQACQQLRSNLPAEVQATITESLWKSHRTYVPNPHYDASQAIEWSRARSAFKDLRVPVGQIVVMPHVIEGFEAFFDAVADEMRAIAGRLANV